jgi:hypothetical protein
MKPEKGSENRGVEGGSPAGQKWEVFQHEPHACLQGTNVKGMGQENGAGGGYSAACLIARDEMGQSGRVFRLPRAAHQLAQQYLVCDCHFGERKWKASDRAREMKKLVNAGALRAHRALFLSN